MAPAKRLTKELGKIQKTDPDWVTIAPHNDSITHWRASLLGPAESPYEGGTFIVDFVFPADYPFKAPEIKFLTKIYHPNIKTDTGEICADIINSNWAPTLDVMHCLETLKSMLLNPNPDSPVEAQIAHQLREDNATFLATAKQWVQDHAAGS